MQRQMITSHDLHSDKRRKCSQMEKYSSIKIMFEPFTTRIYEKNQGELVNVRVAQMYRL